jgi:hypothetical protein
MQVTTMREKILDEIAKIPDEKVPEIFDFIHYFRMGLGQKTTNPQKILQLAGSWKDLTDDEYNEFIENIMNRRKGAFNSRRNREKSID